MAELDVYYRFDMSAFETRTDLGDAIRAGSATAGFFDHSVNLSDSEFFALHGMFFGSSDNMPSSGTVNTFDWYSDPGSGLDLAWSIAGLSIDAETFSSLLLASDVATLFSAHVFGGDDFMMGSADPAGDHLIAYGGNDVVNGEAGDDVLDGRDGDDTLNGGSGNDRLIGGLGFDTLNGGDGIDTADYSAATSSVGLNLHGYIPGEDAVDSVEIFIGSGFGDEMAGSGNGERFEGRGGNDELSGYEGNDVLIGGEDGDALYGGGGNDRLSGGEGSDWGYYLAADSSVTVDLRVTSAQDTGGAGVDTITSVENLLGSAHGDEFIGTNAANHLDGREGDDHLVGGGGDDELRGGSGTNLLEGGTGNDSYIVEGAGDVIVELAGEGIDQVQVFVATFSIVAMANVEKLAGDVRPIWSTDEEEPAVNHDLTGNSGNNQIDGGAGADTMRGGGGNDLYRVDNVGDTIIEAAGEGIDTVETWVSHSLAANAENLILLGDFGFGFFAADGTGNGLANRMEGNFANNLLNGRAGADTLIGGWGNDTYVIDDKSDRVIETEAGALGGTDKVYASVSFTLGANVENLSLAGDASIAGKGNELANAITGNGGDNALRGLDGNDALRGGAGSDQLYGGLGTDKLTGGTGADKFVFDSALGGTNHDNLSDFSIADDTIVLDRSVFAAFTANGTLAAGNFFAGTAAHDGNDYVIYNSATGNIYYDADGSGAGAKVLIAHVAGGLALTNADFLIVT